MDFNSSVSLSLKGGREGGSGYGGGGTVTKVGSLLIHCLHSE